MSESKLIALASAAAAPLSSAASGGQANLLGLTVGKHRLAPAVSRTAAVSARRWLWEAGGGGGNVSSVAAGSPAREAHHAGEQRWRPSLPRGDANPSLVVSLSGKHTVAKKVNIQSCFFFLC